MCTDMHRRRVFEMKKQKVYEVQKAAALEGLWDFTQTARLVFEKSRKGCTGSRGGLRVSRTKDQVKRG